MPEPFVDEAARCRIAQRAWADTSMRERLAVVRRLRHLFAEHAERLCLATTQDVDRSADEVLGTDVLPSADALRFLERRAARILRPRHVPDRLRPWWLLGERETIHRRPHGIVGVIGTWNYPILLNAVPIAQTLVAGNGVLWKPSELSTTGSELLHELFLAAGFPADLFIRLPATREAGPALLETNIDHLVFTGSADVGRKIAIRCAERMIPTTLELSGCDALFVLDDADADLAARAAWFGVTLNLGQTCLAIRRAFVHRSRHDAFVEVLRRLVEPTRTEPLALMAQALQAERLVGEAVQRGASVLGFNETPTALDDPPRFRPTILIGANPEMAICREASFAPLLGVIPFDNEDELIELSESCNFGLGASVFTSHPRRATRLAEQLRVGSVSINDVLVGTAHPAVPFGGVRHSGWGVTRGVEGLLAMTVPQVVTIRKGKFRPHYGSGDNPAIAQTLRGLLAWGHAARGRERRAGIRQMLRGLWRFAKGFG
ncbi:MAG TPA: aldehyde dehydrogenase family protein [Gemmataceae bacterium]|jgi:acyl-CoA reductase-like NAD-dependent aldehyde dehydrogenase|nr:aldehyde dehydrogenase family protein [Gemmataceae bacterium]